jgi:acyl carrier protein
MSNNIRSIINAIIVDKLGVEESEVTPYASLFNDLGADDLDSVELVMHLEREFEIDIPDAVWERVVSVSDVYQAVEYALSGGTPQSSSAPNQERSYEPEPTATEDFDELLQWIEKRQEHFQSEDGMDCTITHLPPVYVSVVAPSGAGKTSLIAALYKYIDENLGRNNNFIVQPSSKKDEYRLKQINDKIDSEILSGKMMLDSGVGTTQINEFSFDIVMPYSNTQFLAQSFVIMDIPGKFMNPDMRGSNDYKKFETFLQSSEIVWIPIEAPLLVEPENGQERGIASKLCEREGIEECMKLWADFTEKSGTRGSVHFVMTKCETYHSQDTSEDNKKAEECYNRFERYYRPIIDEMEKRTQNFRAYYTPVENIGCLKLVYKDWDFDRKQFSGLFKFSGKQRNVNGVNDIALDLLGYVAYFIHRYCNIFTERAQAFMSENRRSGIFDQLSNRFFNGRTGKAEQIIDMERDLRYVRGVFEKELDRLQHENENDGYDYCKRIDNIKD